MPNPATLATPEGQWTIVATGTTSGQLHKRTNGPVYLQTYRLTGQAAPSSKGEGVLAFETVDSLPISALAAIDVYIWADGKPGSVRVDLGDGLVGSGS